MEGEDPSSRKQLLRQLETLERQVLCLRTQLLPERPAPAREPFTALAIEVAGERYALMSSTIQQIIPLVSWQPLPDSPAWVLGVFRYRGQTLLLIDLQRRLLDQPASVSASMVIIVTRPPGAVGLVAEAVTELIRVAPEDVSPPPVDVSYAPFISGSIAGPGGEILPLLSVVHLRREIVLSAEEEAEES